MPSGLTWGVVDADIVAEALEKRAALVRTEAEALVKRSVDARRPVTVPWTAELERALQAMPGEPESKRGTFDRRVWGQVSTGPDEGRDWQINLEMSQSMQTMPPTYSSLAEREDDGEG